MFPQQLTIQLRRRQLKDIFGADVIYAGTNPLTLSAVPGTIDSNWYDFTANTTGLAELGEAVSLTWTAERTDNGFSTVGSFSPKKSVSGTLTFSGAAQQFIKAHLVEDVAGAINEIEVQLTDTHCNKVYGGYSIKIGQLQWCEYNALCEYNITLQQQDPYINCIQRTMIADNWQGWFQNEPVNWGAAPPGSTTPPLKKHPRFSYCIERRPNFVLILEWMLTSIIAFLWTLIYTVLFPIFIIIDLIVDGINLLIGIINSTIIAAINALISVVGGTPIGDIPLIPDPFPSGVPTPGEVLSSWATLMMEAAGCGREQPAPLIRDYITNVCSKCGVTVAADTADIFFNPFLTLTHSDGLLHTEPNPYYNACYYFPQVQRGVRRFRNIDLLGGMSNPDTTTYYLPGNAPVLALSDFLDELNKLFNTQWQVRMAGTAPTLYIKRKDWFENEAPLYDFGAMGVDRHKIIEGICYEPQDITWPAALGNLYEDDPANKCGVEANKFYNGRQQVSFNNTVINPLFKGILEKSSGFCGTKFNCDGASTNYLYDALQFCYTSSLFLSIAGVSPLLIILAELGTQIQRYANYAILQQTETISLPQVIIWDGDTDNPGDPNYLNAHAVRDKINIAGTVYTIGKSGWFATVPGITTPDINPRYPTQVAPQELSLTTLVPATVGDPVPWIDNHHPLTEVIGRIGVMGSIPDGVYVVKDVFGSTLIPAAAILCNFDMYFEPHYRGNLWDRWHWIDDPYRNPRMNKNWRLRIGLCCEDIERLGLDTPNGQKLLACVTLDSGFYNKGIITEITADYNSGGDGEADGIGQTIELKGTV